ncbi:uncharacterized protein [Spinacia oleracea]|uniref:Retrotransposon Copia-like N-terminal domain-containing protein n=1 Tax=Spinacia oleracea TaxID=3562 RepID=A0A9R0IUX1_SPIOL|nr:uncharacterized protein LOC110795381 [Spinacia oleracea]
MADDKTPPPAPRYEPFSAFYLHPSEGTGAVISPILLKGDNYDHWVKSLSNNLRAKNKLGFLDGTILQPDVESADYDQWNIVNSMLVAWIFNTLHESIQSTVPFPNTVKVLWDDLRDRYSLRNGPRVHELKNKISDCKQRGRSVCEYYGELRTLWGELASALKLPSCSCSAAPEYVVLLENEKLHQFLIGLDSTKYKTEVASLMDPLPSISYAHGKVLSAERHQAVTAAHDTRPDAVGFATNAVAQGRDQAKLAAVSGDSRVCSHCGVKGHVKDKCFELHGYPEWYQGRSRGRGGRPAPRGGSIGRGRARGGFAANVGSSNYTGASMINEGDRSSTPTLSDNQFAKLMASLNVQQSASSTPKLHGKMNNDDWIIDTGASNHMSGNVDLFIDLHDISSSTVGLPNGKNTIATKEGRVKLSDTLILDDVLFVPALTCNLLSVSQLLEK